MEGVSCTIAYPIIFKSSSVYPIQIYTLETLNIIPGDRHCRKSGKLHILETDCAVGLSSLSPELPSLPTVMALALAHRPMLIPGQRSSQWCPLLR